MTSFKLAAVAVTAALALGTAAQAQDKPEFSFNVGVASDYMFRGFSQSDNTQQVYGGADVGIGIFYAGTWLSNVDFRDNSTDMEYDLYAGFKPTLGPVSLDVGIVRYGYTNQPDGDDLDFWEGKVAGSIPAGKGTVGAAVYYTPENFDQTGKATYVELNGSMPVTDKLSVSGAIGRQSVEGPSDYETWNLGVGYAINDVFGIDLRYWDTNVEKADDTPKVATGRIVVGLKAAF